MDHMPPGFRFYPTEEELVSFYLQKKIEGTIKDRVVNWVIPVLDIYEYNPWDLPQMAGDMCNSDQEQWFFFIPRQETEARGGRPRRLTTSGYWKATGSPGFVFSTTDNRSIGMKRTMVFYQGKAPSGTKTEWKMNEYKALERHDASSSSSSTPHPPERHEFSVCRIYKRSKYIRSFDRRPTSVSDHITGAHADVDSLQDQALLLDAPTQLHPQSSLPMADNLINQSSNSPNYHDNSSSSEEHRQQDRVLIEESQADEFLSNWDIWLDWEETHHTIKSLK